MTRVVPLAHIIVYLAQHAFYFCLDAFRRRRMVVDTVEGSPVGRYKCLFRRGIVRIFEMIFEVLKIPVLEVRLGKE